MRQMPLLLVHGQDPKFRQQGSTSLTVPERGLLTHHCSVIKASLLLDPWTAQAANSLTPQR